MSEPNNDDLYAKVEIIERPSGRTSVRVNGTDLKRAVHRDGFSLELERFYPTADNPNPERTKPGAWVVSLKIATDDLSVVKAADDES